MLPEQRISRLVKKGSWQKLAGVFVGLALAAHPLPAAAEMEAAIGGAAGQLARAEVDEVWPKGEVVIRFVKPGDGAARVLLKGVEATLVADGFRFHSSRTWKVTGKQTYSTVAGVERSILVAEVAADSGSSDPEGCAVMGRSAAYCYSREERAGDFWRPAAHIVQILNSKEMLVTMAVGTGIGLKRENAVVLLRGVDTTKLTEDSPPAAFRLQPIRGSVDKYPITGTYRYKSTGGVTRTVFVADAKKAEEEQAAEEDRREEAERNGIEAERESKRKAQAEREAKEKKARAETEAKEKVEMERKAKAEKARWREWTVSGYADKTKFEARFDSLANGTVRLTKHGGETVRVALEDLSADDQAWIRRRYEQRDRSP